MLIFRPRPYGKYQHKKLLNPEEELKLVNAKEFDPRASLGILKWGSIGGRTLTSSTMIRKRQDGIKLLLNSKAMRHITANYSFYPTDHFSKDFFQEYGSRSPYNKRVAHLIRSLESGTKATRFPYGTTTYQDILVKLKEEFAKTVAIEDRMSEVLAVELDNVYSYSGVVSITTTPVPKKDKEGHDTVQFQDSTSLTHDVYGFRDYAFREESNFVTQIARGFLKLYDVKHKDNWEKAGLRLAQALLSPFWIICTLVMSFVEKNRNDVLYTTELPYSVRNEIADLHATFLRRLRDNLYAKIAKDGIRQSDWDAIVNSISIGTEFQFILNGDAGFVVRLIDVTSNIKVEETYLSSMSLGGAAAFDPIENIFSKGTSIYSKLKKKLFKSRAIKLSNEATIKAIRLPLQYALEGAIASSRELLAGGSSNVVSEKSYEAMLSEVKYSNLRNAIDGLGLENDWQTVSTFRKSVSSLFSDLNALADKARTIWKTREKFGHLPFCFPTVLDDDHNVISFDNLAPIHLIGSLNKDRTKELASKDLRLIKGLPALNGQILSLTGQNGGGKTATEVEMINATIQAHMGLPVFADHFSFNAKNVIAMVFVEKGQGSMLQLLMEKLKIVAEEIEKNKDNKIVVVIDELLTGTQEADGLEIGRQYLRMLSRKKCSILFVTQITQLAQFSKDELGANCFYFDKDGSMKPGIGRGNARHLAEEVGLEKYLELKN
ncbi:MAG: hypothetical protein JWM20_434 [Patescibacteria group bacterium]|nr:hypothetical protein [Patescibacteria group bacterium]